MIHAWRKAPHICFYENYQYYHLRGSEKTAQSLTSLPQHLETFFRKKLPIRQFSHNAIHCSFLIGALITRDKI